MRKQFIIQVNDICSSQCHISCISQFSTHARAEVEETKKKSLLLLFYIIYIFSNFCILFGVIVENACGSGVSLASANFLCCKFSIIMQKIINRLLHRQLKFHSPSTTLPIVVFLLCEMGDIDHSSNLFLVDHLSEVTLLLSIVTFLWMHPCWAAPLIRHPQRLYMVERQVEATAFLIGCLNATSLVLFVCQGRLWR